MSVINNINRFLSWCREAVQDETERGKLIRDLKKSYLKYHQYRMSFDERPTAAVFGISQVGKSYLVNQLVSEEGEIDLKIPIPGNDHETLSFKTDLMPNKPTLEESSGVVTRFTSNPIHQGLNGKFKFSLFSDVELICMIANSFYNNVRFQENYQGDLLENRLDHLKNQMSDLISELNKKYNPDPYKYSHSESIGNYFINYFNGKLIFNSLKEFLPKITMLHDYLNVDEKVNLYSLLWNEDKDLTKMFKALLDGLDRLNNETNVYVGKDAFTLDLSTNNEIKAEFTVLDVLRIDDFFRGLDNNGKSRTQKDLDNGRQEKDLPPLEVFKRQNKNELISLASMDRGVFSCLIKEAIVYVGRNKLNYDILDFPGARSPNPKGNDIDYGLVVRRGKVSYLFQVYNSSNHLNALIWCHDDQPPNVNDLCTNYITKWVKSYIGNDDVSRYQNLTKINQQLDVPFQNNDLPNPLLYVITKFNNTLEGSSMGADKLARFLGNPAMYKNTFQTQILANFVNYYQEDWLTNFYQNKQKEDSPFKNIYFLRDPDFSGSFILNEREYNNSVFNYEQRIKDLEEVYFGCEAVDTYVADKSKKWQEVSRPGHDGSQLIIDYLNRVCTRQIKDIRMKDILIELLNEIEKSLEKYSLDIGAEEKEKQQRKQRVLEFARYQKDLLNLNKKGIYLGNLLSKMMIDDSDVKFVLSQLNEKKLDALQVDNGNKDSNQAHNSSLRQELIQLGYISDNTELTKDLAEEILCQEYGEDWKSIVQEVWGIDFDSIQWPKEKEGPKEKHLAYELFDFWSVSKMGELRSIEDNKNVIGFIQDGLMHSPEKDKFLLEMKKEIDPYYKEIGIVPALKSVIARIAVNRMNRFIAKEVTSYNSEVNDNGKNTVDITDLKNIDLEEELIKYRRATSNRLRSLRESSGSENTEKITESQNKELQSLLDIVTKEKEQIEAA
jgi:hypothetical protein